jgi:hypothetical protein
MLVSETHAKTTLKMSGYLVYQRNETNQQGYPFRGLAVLIRRSIIHQPVDFVAYASLTALGVDIRVNNGDLRMYSVYRPPTSPLGTLREDPGRGLEREACSVECFAHGRSREGPIPGAAGPQL